MKKISEISFKIINQILEIREGEVISLSGEIHNAVQSINPLSEISILEELAIAIRKKKAFPHLEISTEHLKERFFSEITDEIMSLQPKYYFKWVDDLDAFIEVGWKNINQNLIPESTSQLQKLEQSLSSIWQKIIEQKKKIIFLNFPSHELSTLLDQNYEQLLEHFLSLLNANYEIIQQKADELAIEFTGKNLTLFSKEEKLTFYVKNSPAKIFSGKIQSTPIVILPTGKIEQEIERITLEGILSAEKVYYKNNYYDNIKIYFEQGDIRYLTFSEEKKGNFLLENAVINSKMQCFFSLGLNPGCRSLTNYYSYDRCINNCVSLKFFDANNEPILFLNRQIMFK